MNHSDHVALLRDGIAGPGKVWADLGSGAGRAADPGRIQCRSRQLLGTPPLVLFKLGKAGGADWICWHTPAADKAEQFLARDLFGGQYGEWRVAGGGWRVASGGWRVAGGGWRVAGGGLGSVIELDLYEEGP